MGGKSLGKGGWFGQINAQMLWLRAKDLHRCCWLRHRNAMGSHEDVVGLTNKRARKRRLLGSWELPVISAL